MALKVTTIPLCKSEVIGAQGTAGTFTSDVVDMRDIVGDGVCSLTMVKHSTSGDPGTTGSSVASYLVAGSRDGTFATAGTFSTLGHNVGPRIKSFTPETAPFMKIRVITGTSNPLVLTAELNVR